MIPPERRDYLREPGDMHSEIDSRSRKVEWLPMVRCIGVFSSIRPARDESKDESYLTFVWFQNKFAMPVAQKILDQIKSIQWNELAADIENN